MQILQCKEWERQANVKNIKVNNLNKMVNNNVNIYK